MILPELPAYLSSLGGAEYKGFIISLFTLTAGISRPFSGKLADTIGRIPIIIFGAVVCVICSLLYPILTSVSGFMLLRLVHGFSTGFTPTAITAYVADIVPDHRRGEAMGIIGVAINLGASIGPPVGSQIAISYSLNTMFMVSSLVALVSLLMLLGIKETLPVTQRFSPELLLLNKEEIIDKSAVVPGIVCGLLYMGFGTIITITPDQSEYMGMSNKGLFFTSITVFSIMARLVSGTLSDRWGRLIVIRISIVLLVLSYILLGMTDSPNWLLMASGCFGFSLGVGGPVIMAWGIDRSQEHRRAQAIATIFIGLEVAIGFGALFGAFMYDNTPSNYDITFYWIAGFTALALLFLFGKETAETV